jgi:glyoxylase-like metal-dependent hydrolase (beta-lactamase superfamily II)
MMRVKHFFDPDTYTLSYVVYDESTTEAVLIDPVLDFDPASGKITSHSIQQILTFVRENDLNLLASLETHAHADHLSGAHILKNIFPSIKIGISEKIKLVQETFKAHFNLNELKTDGSQFDLLFKDNEEINLGSIKMKVIPTPGHTPACVSYLFGQHLFTGDALFMPDYGTGRCDFPKGSAKDLYHSIHQNIYSLPDDTIIYVGHDYQPNDRPVLFMSTVGESKKSNIQLKVSTNEDEFITFRQNRDKTLKAPKLLLPSIQVNIDGGRIPHQESNGKSYLKIPVNMDLSNLKV